jgi:hypothetical protein
MMSHSEFRVLFHLCDCHNPAQGCFPTQSYLLHNSGVSNGTLNNALNGLERKGLIARQRSWNGKTHRQQPTRYILGFEMETAREPSPENGDGPRASRLQPVGDGAVSNLGGEPSPIQGVSRLQPTGDITCKEPVKNLGARKIDEIAEFWSMPIKDGKTVPVSAINITVATRMLELGLVSEGDLKSQGIAY